MIHGTRASHQIRLHRPFGSATSAGDTGIASQRVAAKCAPDDTRLAVVASASEAIHRETVQDARWIASSLALLAMTTMVPLPPIIASASEAIHRETEQGARWISSSLTLLAMTTMVPLPPVIASASEAIHRETVQDARWISSSLTLLAMTNPGPRLAVIASQRVRAKRGPMTGSAKQSIARPNKVPDGLLRRLRSSQ